MVIKRLQENLQYNNNSNNNTIFVLQHNPHGLGVEIVGEFDRADSHTLPKQKGKCTAPFPCSLTFLIFFQKNRTLSRCAQ